MAASILLVDDNRNGLVARKTLLEEQGYQVTTATDGEEGFEAFTTGRCDLVVTDYKMPRMNGTELIGRIRESCPQTPIILLSGFIEAMGLDESTAGADAIVAKGNNEVAHLLRAVSRLLNRRPPRRPPATHRTTERAKTV